ncbi:hypothetical protein GRI69_15505 [Erythrobacter vulgaris]|uniref:Uncharacterized protein n=1 Tax=Qipengyuania vulgaris TaxID=291985 RepID=A0A844XWS4_9SPHN|nr:hypothetical protein [Qipengyuania vulgaris]MXO49657.1 hypothetical protein [Qipengyuania vulgaris]
MKLYLNWESIHVIQRYLDFGIEPEKLYVRWDDEGETYVGTEGLDLATYNRLAPLLWELHQVEGWERTK